MTNIEAIVPKVYIVAVYLCDRAYGGPEEGGWWYDTGEFVRQLKQFKNEDKAYEYCQRLNTRLNSTEFGPNKGRRAISSVPSEGQYFAGVYEDRCPEYYPERTPHYE